MPTITISSGTTNVSTPIPNTTAYIVEGPPGGTLDIVSGGVVSGLITVSNGGQTRAKAVVQFDDTSTPMIPGKLVTVQSWSVYR